MVNSNKRSSHQSDLHLVANLKLTTSAAIYVPKPQMLPLARKNLSCFDIQDSGIQTSKFLGFTATALCSESDGGSTSNVLMFNAVLE
jgi:hypothetical protein